jgi:hypothetical protein
MGEEVRLKREPWSDKGKSSRRRSSILIPNIASKNWNLKLKDSASISFLHKSTILPVIHVDMNPVQFVIPGLNRNPATL